MVASEPFPTADYWEGQSFGPGRVSLVRRGAGQRKTVTQEPAEGIRNILLSSQFCCQLPQCLVLFIMVIGGGGNVCRQLSEG